jgi:hypothetical protein
MSSFMAKKLDVLRKDNPHAKGNSSPTRAISFAKAIREVSCERGF